MPKKNREMKHFNFPSGKIFQKKNFFFREIESGIISFQEVFFVVFTLNPE